MSLAETVETDRKDLPQSALVRMEDLVAAAALALVPLLPLAEIVSRKFFSRGIPGALPIVQHLTLWVTMLGAIIAARSGRLLTLSTASLLPERWVSRARIVSSGAGAVVCVWLAKASLDYLVVIQAAGDRLAWGIPLWWALTVIPLGFALIGVRLLLVSCSRLRTRMIALVAVAAIASPALLLAPQPQVVTVALGLVFCATLLGMPIFAAVSATALILFWSEGIPATAVPDEFYKLSSQEFLPAIPLFGLAGYLLSESGAGRRLLRVSSAWFGWFPGGLAVVVTIMLAFFTPLTGASGVTILSLGGLLYPMLVQARYPERTSLGLVTVAGSIGLLLPPSLPVILYAIAAQVPIPKLFLGCLVPGLLLIIATAAWGSFVGVRKGAARQRFKLREALSATLAAKWELVLPLLLLVSYFGGYATLVETAAITAAYTFFIEIFVHRDLRGQVLRIITESATTVSAFLVIVGAALALTNYLVTIEAPAKLVEVIRTSVHSPLVFLLVLNLFLIVVGALMDIYSAILVIVPLVVPMAAAYSIDPIHLGVIFLANMELGYLMPPMGENLFLSATRFRLPLGVVYRATLPYILMLLVAVLLITYVPQLTLIPAGLVK